VLICILPAKRTRFGGVVHAKPPPPWSPKRLKTFSDVHLYEFPVIGTMAMAGAIPFVRRGAGPARECLRDDVQRHAATRKTLTRRGLLVRSLGFASSALLLSSCSGLPLPGAPPLTPHQQGAASPPVRGGVLRISQRNDIALGAVPQLLIPQNLRLYSLVYDTLVANDAQLQPQPRLATSWQWSSDFRQLTIKLRSGARFHTGAAFTSADAKFNLERLRDPSLGSQWTSYAQQMHIDASDPGTLIITYDAPSRSSFDALIGTYMAEPQSIGNAAFIGTGPFRFQDWVQGDHLTFVRNPDYWQAGKPYVDQVVLSVQPDQQASLISVESNNLDWMTGVAGNDARRLQADPAYQVLLTGSGGNNYYAVCLDTSVPELADRRVRQAFSYALNRERIVDSALAGYGRAASTIWPPQALGYDAAQDRTYDYDLSRARQLLASAGWNSNTTIPLRATSTLPTDVAIAEIYQADLAAIGVNAVVQPGSSAELVTLIDKHQIGGALITATGLMNLSPATFFTANLYARVPNPSNFTSDRYSSLI